MNFDLGSQNCRSLTKQSTVFFAIVNVIGFIVNTLALNISARRNILFKL